MSETLHDRVAERPIQFYFQGKLQQVEQAKPTRTVLQFLREDCRATGTKEGCAEGDCGACTVVVGELKRSVDGEQQLQLRAINSCIQFLPTLDGKALFSVEDVAQSAVQTDAAKPVQQPQHFSLNAVPVLHPVQQAMVEQHASQCGFCTPGFVMSLWAMYEQHADCPAPEQITEYLSGNLCRCTGYRPILEAAKAAYLLPRQTLATQRIIAALSSLQQQQSLAYSQQGQHFFAPQTIEELAQRRMQYPQARLLAGSTDIGLWVTKQGRALGDIIYLGAVAELKTIRQTGEYLEIGAMASLTDAFAALTGLQTGWTELARRFASRPIQNAGTLGGNVANGSPIGDSMPGLIVLNAQLVLQQGEVVRELPLDEFYLAYQKTALARGEFVRSIKIPHRSDAEARHHFSTYKITKRHEQDISAVCGAFSVYLNEQNRVQHIRMAYGGMAAIPKRAIQAEQAMLGQLWNEQSMQQAQQALVSDFSPLTDGRASREYRQRIAASLLQRFYLESLPANSPDLIAVPQAPSRLGDLIVSIDISAGDMSTGDISTGQGVRP